MLQNAHYSGNWNTDSWGSGMHDGGMMMGWGLHGFVSILFLTLIGNVAENVFFCRVIHHHQ